MSLATRYLDPVLLERLSGLQLSARRVVEGATLGQHRSPLRGASIEFRQHRPYVPGDEPRRLDWRVLARTDRPYVREYHEETNLRCVLLLDRSGSMAFGKKFDYAAKIVASIGYLMLQQGESVGLASIANGIEQWLAPHAGKSQLSRLIGSLERTAASGIADLPRALSDASSRVGRRALLILVSDLFCDPNRFAAAMGRLRQARHEVIVLRVLHEDEVRFPFDGWVRLRGLEGESPQLCEPAMVRQRYMNAFAKHELSLKQSCGSNDVEFHTFVTSRDAGDALVGFLKHRASA
jgi:uncharacterized protein (DUF58 family)